MKNNTFGECCYDVAVKYGLGPTLVAGHPASYWIEAAEEYARLKVEESEKKKEEIIRELKRKLKEQEIV